MLFLSILIFFKNIFFYGKILQIKEYRLDRILDWLNHENGLKIIFNKIFFIYLFLFFLSNYLNLSIFINFVYFVLFLEVFLIFFNIFKKKFIIPRFTGRFFLIFLVSVFINIFLIKNIDFGSISLKGILFFISILNLQFFILLFSIFITFPISYFLKKRKIDLATSKIAKFKKLKKIGITGSYGKSTVKEFLFCIFDNKFSTIKTPKNHNTPMGISDLILNKLDDTYEYFFCEMGAYKIGEIDELGDIVDHKYGFLTGINNQHISLFGSQTNIILGKFEIANKVFLNKGTLYVNGDNRFCRKIDFPNGLNVVFYGMDAAFNSAYSEIIDFSEDGILFDFFYKNYEMTFKIKLIGKHNILNLTGAIAFALDQGMTKDDIQNGLDYIKMPEKNLNLIKKTDSIFLINDTYNINYDGIIASSESLDIFENSKKILILDDIPELGKESLSTHFELGKKLSKFDFEKIYLIGRQYKFEVEKGLLQYGFPKEKIFHNFIFKYFGQNILEPKNNEKYILLFEGRGSEKYFKIFQKFKG